MNWMTGGNQPQMTILPFSSLKIYSIPPSTTTQIPNGLERNFLGRKMEMTPAHKLLKGEGNPQLSISH